MSKSRGNVLNPLDVINGQTLENLVNEVKNSRFIDEKEKKIALKAKKKEFPQGISKCGSDALRFGLLSYMIQTGDINLNVERIEANRRMCNKVWNTIKFASQFFDEKFAPRQELILVVAQKRLPHRWILHCLNEAVGKINQFFTEFRFGEAT